MRRLIDLDLYRWQHADCWRTKQHRKRRSAQQITIMVRLAAADLFAEIVPELQITERQNVAAGDDVVRPYPSVSPHKPSAKILRDEVIFGLAV